MQRGPGVIFAPEYVEPPGMEKKLSSHMSSFTSPF